MTHKGLAEVANRSDELHARHRSSGVLHQAICAHARALHASAVCAHGKFLNLSFTPVGFDQRRDKNSKKHGSSASFRTPGTPSRNSPAPLTYHRMPTAATCPSFSISCSSPTTSRTHHISLPLAQHASCLASYETPFSLAASEQLSLIPSNPSPHWMV